MSTSADRRRAGRWLATGGPHRIGENVPLDPGDVESLAAEFAAVRIGLDQRVVELEAVLRLVDRALTDQLKPGPCLSDPCMTDEGYHRAYEEVQRRRLALIEASMKCALALEVKP